MVYSTSHDVRTADRTERQQSTVVQMIGKYFSQMTTSSRRGSVESYDERDPGSSGEDVLIYQCVMGYEGSDLRVDPLFVITERKNRAAMFLM